MRKGLLKISTCALAGLILSLAFSACVNPFDKNDGNVVELSFYGVNDLHGKIMDTPSQPGVDEFTSYMKGLYAAPDRDEILLSSGDMWQGTVESSSNKGELMTEWMNEVGFSSMTLGNHEYDWGPSVLAPNSEKANFPFLGINITYNGAAVEYCKPSVTVERKGVKIGIIGAMGNCLSSISGEFSGGLKFATGDELTNLVKNESVRLRSEGCKFIVYSLHDGGDNFSSSGINAVTNADMVYYDSSLSNGYVDLVFEAHSHQKYILKDEYGVYHLQGGGENAGISLADVSFNIKTSKYTVKPEIVSNKVYASSAIKGDAVVNEIFTKYFPDENPYTTAVGRIASQKDSSTICKQLARLYFERGKKQWGTAYNIVLGGGYLKLRTPYKLNRGDVTPADIFSILPFDNSIVLGKIKGSKLKSEFIDNPKYTTFYDAAALGEIVDDGDYYIVIDTYTSTYAQNGIVEIDRIAEYPRALLAEFIKGGGWA